MKLIYLFKNYFESDKCFYTKNMFENKTNSKRVKIINKTYLTERLFNSNFLCNLFYGKISDDYLKEIIQTMINISYSNRNISNKRVCKRSNYDFYHKLSNSKNKKKNNKKIKKKINKDTEIKKNDENIKINNILYNLDKNNIINATKVINKKITFSINFDDFS
jgi:hypothetical protein